MAGDQGADRPLEIGERGVGYRKYSEQLSGYPTIQSAMEGGFSKRVNR